MRRVTAVVAAVVAPLVVTGGALVTAAPSSASACSSASGGVNHTFIKAENATTGGLTGYNCAYSYATGTLTIAPATPTSLVSNSELGYRRTDGCTYASDPSVSVTESSVDGSGASTSSERWDVTNTSTSSRRWAAAVLWMMRTNSTNPAPNQYSLQCKAGASVWMNAFYQTSSVLGNNTASNPIQAGVSYKFSIYVTADGNSAVNGPRASLYRQLGSSPSPSSDSKQSSASLNLGYADLPGTYTVNPSLIYATVDTYGDYSSMTPPSVGFIGSMTPTISVTVKGGTSAASRADTPMSAGRAATIRRQGDVAGGLRPVVRQVTGRGDLAVRCPSGTALISAFAGSPTTTYSPASLTPNSSGTGLSLRGSAGHTGLLQVVCRSAWAPKLMIGRTGWGSVSSDTMTTAGTGSSLFGGLGADRLVAAHARSHLYGGLGPDVLEVRGVNSTAEGGPGADRLTAVGSGALLFGGAGPDLLVTGTAAALVNARDGRGGDVVRCGSDRTRVLLDAGDITRGPCTVV